MSIFITLDGRQLLAKRLWIYPSDPFQNPIPHLIDDQLWLFDPARSTAERWEETSLKFREQKNVDALAELKSGVLVIGDGVSFREYRGLPEVIHKAAQRGLKVLCLSPVAGTLLLSDGDDEPRSIVNLRFARADILADFDKHLDDLDWRGASPVGDVRMQLISKSNQMSADFVSDGLGWPWLEAEYSGGGRIIVSCFHCIEHWDTGPAPRHAMWHILAQAIRPIDGSNSEPN